MMIREIGFTLKIVFRDKSFVFWTIVYPLILTTFFYLALGSLLSPKEISFKVGVEADSGLEQIFSDIPVFELKSLSREEVKAALKSKDIIAFVTKDLQVQVNASGVGQTTVQNTVQTIKQIIYAFENGGNAQLFDPSQEFITEKVMKISPFSLVFYSTLAMVAFYGFFGSINIMAGVQANISELGKRMCVSPIRKMPYIIANVIMVFILNVSSNLILILYMNYFLKIKLFFNYPLSIGLILAGNLCGVTAGILVGVLTIPSQLKTAIGVGMPLLMSALAGMMNVEIKGIIMRHVPILDRLNPASIITTGLYRINLLDTFRGYMTGIGILLGMSLIFMILSITAR
ncbi:ABC transporter permease [Clostridiales bacterium COT073_COT-073]|nr:ABC transporter permease [Clostridiales bacterium COT073_COT-073]